MVQMAPNSALVKATVSKIKAYDKQPGYSIVHLDVKEATRKKSEAFLYDHAEDKQVKVLVSDQKLGELNLKVKDSVEGELKKVNIDLWKVNENSFRVK